MAIPITVDGTVTIRICPMLRWYGVRMETAEVTAAAIGLATMENCEAMTAIDSGRSGRMPLRRATSAITGSTE